MGPSNRLTDQGIMSCQFTRESISSYVDNRLSEQQRRNVALHLAACRDCARLHARTVELRENLRSLPVAHAPSRLATDLQILASREVVRSRRMVSASAWIGFWADRARLLMDNMMRPLALPAAGGFTSALFIFGMLMPNLGFLRTSVNDHPTALYTDVGVPGVGDFASRNKSSDDTLIEVQINEQGRIVDYDVLQGQMTNDIGSLLLELTEAQKTALRFTTFTPAPVFLQPTSGKIVIRRSQIVVKG
jgi:Putative zinc-finger